MGLGKKSLLGGLGALLVLGLLLYGPTLYHPFVYDDDSFVLLNESIRSLKNVSKFFLDPSTLASDSQLAHDNYRPLVTLSFAFNYALGELRPFGYRLLNLLLHIGNAWLVFWLALLFFEARATDRLRAPVARLAAFGAERGQTPSLLRPDAVAAQPGFHKHTMFAALLAAATFLVHPVQVESVVFISSRSNVLSLFFFLLAFIAHLRRGRASGISLSCFMLALLSKEMAIVLPLLLGLWDAYSGSEERKKLKGLFLRVLPYFLAAGAYLAVRVWMLERVGQTGYWAGGFYPTMLTMCKGFATYLRLMVWPSPLSLEYLFSVSHSILDPKTAFCALLLAATIAFALRYARRLPGVSFGILFFFIGLLPVSNIIPIKAVIAERFLYLSVIGFGLAAGELGGLLIRGRFFALCPIVLLAFSLLTLRRGYDWRSAKSLILATLKTAPQSARMHYGLGRQYAAEGDFKGAAEEFKVALAIDPSYDEALRDVGNIAMQEGRYKDAIDSFRKTLQVRINVPDGLYNLGIAYLKSGESRPAAESFEAALSMLARGVGGGAPAELEGKILTNLAAAYYHLGHVEKAIATTERALSREPQLLKARQNLELFRRERLSKKATSGPAQFVFERFPELAPKLLAFPNTRYEPAVRRRGRLEVSGYRPTDGYLGSAKRYEELKAPEREALESLASRNGYVPGAEFFFPKSYGTIDISLSEGYRLQVTPLSVHRAALAKFEGTILVYPNAYPATDVLYVVGHGEAEKMYLLRERRPENRAFRYRVAANENIRSLQLREGRLAVLGKGDDSPVLELTPPVIIDSDGKKVPGSYHLGKAGGEGRQWVLTLAFNDSGLKYPLLIDPTWRTGKPMVNAQRDSNVVLMADGRVLVIGGTGSTLMTQIYDPMNGTWRTTGSLASARNGGASVLLKDGRVLVMGGGTTSSIATCEIYNPVTGLWSTATSMTVARRSHSATLLPDGGVLVAGGLSGLATYLATSSTYTVSNNYWAPNLSFTGARAIHTATLLRDGRVLMTGGGSGGGATCQMYYSTHSWGAAKSMLSSRSDHTATLLTDGRVLVAGGSSLSTAEIYDVAQNTWTRTGNNMAAARTRHQAALLPNGNVIAIGGTTDLLTADIYDPIANSWSATGSLLTGRQDTVAILLPNGKVMVPGGGSTAQSSMEYYDPAAGSWTLANSMSSARQAPATAFLSNGKILVAGGAGASVLATAELYDPAAGSWAATGSMSSARKDAPGALLANGKVLVAGGSDGTTHFKTAELYDPAGTWSNAGAMSAARSSHTATLLANGKVLIVGGHDGSSYVSTAELYDPATNGWASAGSLSSARKNHFAAMLPTGKVLVGGGVNGSGALSTAELYDPNANSWSTANAMNAARESPSATLISSGAVLVAGGSGLSSAEIYNPWTGIWTSTGSMASARRSHSATLLPDGKVYVAGGWNGSTNWSSTEIFDPALGSWVTANALNAARRDHIAALTPSAKLLLAGGAAGAALASAEQAFYTEYNFQGSTLAAQPKINTLNGSAPPITVAPGSNITVVGTSFTFVSDAHQSDHANSAQGAGAPRVYLKAFDSGGPGPSEAGGFIKNLSTYVYANAWSSTTLTFTVPSDFGCGYHHLWIMSRAVPSTFTAIQALPAAPVAAPSAGSPEFTGVFYSSVTAQWTGSGESGVQNYWLQASTDSSFNGELFHAYAPASGNAATVTGLAQGTTYYFRVAAENCNNRGPYFNFVSSTRTLAEAVPCAVTKTVCASGCNRTTINDALADIPTDMSGGYSCVLIKDNRTYTEQVTIQGFATGVSSLTIMSDVSVNPDPVIDPPAGSTAAFRVLNSSVNIFGVRIIPTSSIPYGIRASSANVTLSSVSVLGGTSSRIYTAGVSITSFSVISYSSVSVFGGNGEMALYMDGSLSNISYSTAALVGGSGRALYLYGGSSNTVTSCLISGGAGNNSEAAYIHAANNNTLSFSTITASTGDPGGVALSVNSAYSNTIRQNRIEGGNGSGVVSFGGQGIYVFNSSSNTITQNLISGGNGGDAPCCVDGNGGDGATAIYLSQSSSMTISLNVATGGNGGAGYGTGEGALGGHGLALDSVSLSTATQNNMSGGSAGGGAGTPASGSGAHIASGHYNLISQSTITAGGGGIPGDCVYITGSSTNTIAGNLTQGSGGGDAVKVIASIGTIINNNYFGAGNSAGVRLFNSGSFNLSISSNVFSIANDIDSAIRLDLSNGGHIRIYANTIGPGPLYGIIADAQNSGTTLVIASNTISPSLLTSNSYGVYLGALPSGATVEYNNIYLRGSSGAGSTVYGIYTNGASKLHIHHNRISNPGAKTAGSFLAANLSNTTTTLFTFNDIYSTGTGLTNAYLLKLENNSAAAQLKGNVFFSSVSVTGAGSSSATISISANSQTNFMSNYNDFFSSNSFNTGIWGTQSCQLLSGWRAVSCANQDANSISAHPLWNNTGQGVEDFHPKSEAGRYSPSAGWVTDTQTSETIDKAAATDDYSLEPTPNGNRANLGSYGNTYEASKSTLTAAAALLSWVSPSNNAGFTLNRRPKLWFVLPNNGGSRTDAKISVSTSTGFEVAISTTFQYSASGSGWAEMPASAGTTVYFTPTMDLATNTTTLYLRAATYESSWSDWSSNLRILLRGDWAWTDPSLASWVSTIREAHVTELRSVTGGIAAFRGLSAPSWTDPSISPSTTPVRAVHINELRSKIYDAVVASSATAPTWTDPGIVTSTVAVRTVHINELRNQAAVP